MKGYLFLLLTMIVATSSHVASAASRPELSELEAVVARLPPEFGHTVIVDRDGDRLLESRLDRVIWPDSVPIVERWRWASVSKQLIAVLVMQEAAAERIQLDRPVAEYFPAFRSSNAGRITVRQLLKHQSGLPNPDATETGPGGVPSFYLENGPPDAAGGYCAGKPIAEPGGKWSYNNCDYIVLGAMLETVTGKTWEQLVHARIARPAGMRTLSFGAGEVGKGSIAGKEESEVRLWRYGPAGSIVGTADDLIRFDKALMGGKLLPAKALAEMWTGDPALGYMALGQWAFHVPLKGCQNPVNIIERRGAIGGVQVRNLLVPEIKLAIVAFVGSTDFDFGEIWQGSGFSHDLLRAAMCGASKQ